MARGDLGTLVRICDPAGRPRGTGFVADDRGTVVTSHEAVDGLASLVLHALADPYGPGSASGGACCRTGADAVTALPEAGLALVRTEGLGARPLPITARTEIEPGTYVRIAAHGWREARVLGPAAVTYIAVDGLHPIGDALELAIGTEGAEALRLGGQAAGGPVVDPATGAVVAVLGTALRGARHAAGYAVPLASVGALEALLRRSAATVPCYGPDLNLAGVLELTATSTGSAGAPRAWADPVERNAVVREFSAFAAGEARVLALVGAPGTGRTTALAAHCARRALGSAPAPTVWLRGADLRAEDASVADAVGRALGQAGRIVAASGACGDVTAATPERAAALARAAGRPLLVILDGPEEMPPRLAHRLAAWTQGTERWLGTHGVRLVLGCRPEHWEQAAPLYSRAALHRGAEVVLGELSEHEARVARERYGLTAADLADADARHPLALRLLAEVREALPGQVPGRPCREEIFQAYVDLMCLRVAVRIAAGSRPLARGTAVRRLAARVAGQVHEAARRCLGPGQGELDRESFEEIFPWRTGWASAALTEGLLVPAGSGYRFAHEELSDWLQAAHLDVDEALRTLIPHGTAPRPLPEPRGAAPGGLGSVRDPVPGGLDSAPPRYGQESRRAAPGRSGDGNPRPAAGGSDAEAPPALPVPRHRMGPVLQALLLLGRERGPAALAPRLEGMVDALGRLAESGLGDTDGAWWGGHLLAETLLRVSEPRAHLPVLRRLADRVAAVPPTGDGDAFAPFGPPFWEALRIGEDERFDLLRRLVPAHATPRFLDAVAARLVAEPRGVQPLLCRWFADDRPLAAAPHATVATAAQALLHTHRNLAVDDLCEALVATTHPLADGLLGALAEDEPSAMCRAVDRWAHDDGRPERRAAAATYGGMVARHATTGSDRALLRYAALALLARPDDTALHGPALALLLGDPLTRPEHLADPRVPVSALAAALADHPEPVLAAFRTRLLGRPGEEAGDILRAVAEVTTPALARRAAALVRAYVDRHPEGAGHAAAYVDRRLEEGPAARAVLFPLVTALIHGGPAQVRGSLAPILAAPGTGASRYLRGELLDVLLTYERDGQDGQDGGRDGSDERRDLSVPDALLRAAARDCERRPEVRTREIVLRAGLLLVRTPEGATCLDRRLVDLARELPAFAAQLTGWLDADPDEWAVVVGPSTLRTLRALVSSMPMRTERREHGSLRPA
ncbi:serine protease [Streptomyces sp. QHH-9511]|uniref:trypsin-like peptidase domain-containing protein n=1 Tax=Streptomyces sp. QHH-9511 TaxID=2684468 RepID=UPI0013199AC9|nr:trypsin-like peptidase domain-containing protein [Streptomyces sp. QHH-9511]QGZ51321.1 serine protease [Streptomyces sp. QHH-9511]